MAFSPLPVKAAGDLFDLAAYNICKDDFDASAPGVVAVKGDLVAAIAVNAIARLAVGPDNAILVADSGEATGLAWQIVPAARVYNDAGIAIGAASWTTLTFNQERYDPEGCHSTVANTGRLTVPAGGAGIYHIDGMVEVDMPGAAGDSLSGLRIRLDGATVIGRDEALRPRDEDVSFSVGCDYELAVGQYVELQYYSGGGYDILQSDNYSPVFSWHWIRRPS